MPALLLKCRAGREIKNPKSIVMKNKRPATQGACTTWACVQVDDWQ